MKLPFVMTLSLLSVFQAWAQSYEPLVVKGKRWNCQPGYYDMDSEQLYRYNTYFTILGDTLIDDVSWKKLYYYSEYRDSMVYIGGMREEDRKVFYYEGTESPVFTSVRKPVLLYDFSLQAGETMPLGTGDMSLDYIANARLYETKTEVLENGRAVNVYVFDSDVWTPTDRIPTTVWFEGIGTNRLFWPESVISLPTSNKAPRRTGNGWSVSNELESSLHNYISCELNGTVLAKYSELNALTYEEIIYNAVSLPAEIPNQSVSLFDLQGRRLTQAPAKGVFIQNGKKVIY